LQVKLCDPCLSALCVPWCKKALYKYSSFPFFLLRWQELHPVCDHSTFQSRATKPQRFWPGVTAAEETNRRTGWPRVTWNIVMAHYTASQKHVPPSPCYNFDTHEWILMSFDRNVTDKVGNQKTLYCATSNTLCFCTTWQNGETRKSHFHSVGLCYAQNAPVHCLLERKSCHLLR